MHHTIVFFLHWYMQHKLSLLNSFLYTCSCSYFPHRTFDGHVHKQKCNTSATDSSPWRRKGVWEKVSMRGKPDIVCVCMGVCLCANNMFLMFLPVTDEYFILSLFKTRHSQLAMNKSHLSALFSDALSKLNTKLGIPLRSQEWKLTQITHYNLYVWRQLN